MSTNWVSDINMMHQKYGVHKWIKTATPFQLPVVGSAGGSAKALLHECALSTEKARRLVQQSGVTGDWSHGQIWRAPV